MTRLPISILPLVIGAALAGHAAAHAPAFRVVVHADNTAAELSRELLRALFVGEETHWDDGTPVEAVDLSQAEVRQAFYASIVGDKDRGLPPLELATDQEVLDYVSRHRGAVGYVSASAPPVDGVRIVRLTDLDGAFDETVDSASYPPSGDTTTVVAKRGDVRLLLTGACGPGDEGRQAVLQNRHPYAAVRVTTETALWTDGRLSASRLHSHSLEGHEEVSLGCTAAGPHVERRFVLVEVSDAAVRSDPRLDDRRPPRDFIALVEAGTCGQDGQGQRMAVVNQHPEREIAVSIEHVVKIGERITNRSMRSLRIAPGAQKYLGCSRAGNVVHEYYLRRAD